MKNSNIYICLIFLFIALPLCAQTLKEGHWYGHLNLQQSHQLFFNFSVDGNQKMVIYNGEENVEMKEFTTTGDSIKVGFSNFSNYLIFKVNPKNPQQINGFFVNPYRKTKRRIALKATFFGREVDEMITFSTENISGQWKVTFAPKTKDEYPAIGKFKQDHEKISGTFLTETGDYRFLSGYFINQQLYLSSFDGAHVFLFTANLERDTLKGKFLSGNHWKTDWIGVKNDTFKLKNPDSLTYMIKEDFKFNFKTVDKKDYHYPNKSLNGKVVIVQILGTWCPNCLDETMFYKSLYKEYHHLGLEIIGVAYEYPTTFEEKVEKINHFTTNKNIEFPILVGGIASKAASSKDFNMLNSITSFPTSIFINKEGEVVKIHTGFNGPGTREIYEAYKKKTINLIERLLEIK